jgi:threonine/homoserine/homoserine lactone efflux protein
MTFSSLALYIAVYFVAVATPGPGVAALAARVLAQGLRAIVPFILGFVAGDLVWFTLAATGLSAVARAFVPLFFALKILGAAYLLYVAWGLVRARGPLDPSVSACAGESGARAFLAALSLTLSNPKVIVFFLSIMPLAVDVPSLTPARIAVLAASTVCVLGATLAGYALAAHRARGWMRSSLAANWARKTAAGVMAGVAVAIVAR